MGNMALALDDGRTRSPSSKKSGTIEYRLIFIVTFAVFLVAAAAENLLPHNLMARLSRQGQRKSVIQRAKDSASTCAAYAFMG
jgi:hypothetical protein